MSKVFEDYLSELHTDMVDIGLEYVENRAEDIYIYCSYEPEMYAFDVFYKINGQFVLKNNLNNTVNDSDKELFDTSEPRQEALLDVGLKNLEEIHKKCKEYEEEMPTEIKLHLSLFPTLVN
ncbi:hypothetical protein [Lentibacillus jeotgali]|uniref:hypothetical protein n=1 Tax=Lentibacillus jeotgali TaxID=558169 RepID=UPI0002627479|nr:hypothetical protein [Lentibacillus jeotgali]